MVDAWVNCPNCGNRFGTFLGACPKCGHSSSVKKTSKWLYFGAGIGVGFVSFLVFAVAFALVYNNQPVNNNSISQTSNTVTNSNFSTASKVYEGSLEDLMPTRADLDTTWKFIGPEVVDKPPNGTESIKSSYYVYTGSPFVNVDMHKFDSVDDAERYHNSIVSQLQQRGGYKELDVATIYARCYGAVQELSSNVIGGVMCQKQNIAYRTTVVLNTTYYSDEEIMEIARIIASKF